MSLTDFVIMPGADYQNTCDAVRRKTGGTEPIKSGQLPDAVENVFHAGEQKNEGKWAERFYTTIINGNGENNLSFSLPFDPDYLSLDIFETYARGTAVWAYSGLIRDFRTFSTTCGILVRNANGTYTTTNISNNTVNNTIEYSDGVLNFKHPASFDTRLVWHKNSRFRLIAIKYTEEGKTDADLLKDYILSLPQSGGTVTISSRRFEETGLTEEELNTFKNANNPNWTIVIA